MIGTILQAAAPIFNPNSESPETKMWFLFFYLFLSFFSWTLLILIIYFSSRLAHSVATKMKETENQAKQSEITCCSLYCHWFLSIAVLAEASARLIIHLMIVLIYFIGYYFIFCLSCGKANIGMLKGYQLTRCSLYSGLIFAMLGNICKLLIWYSLLTLIYFLMFNY